MYVVYLTNFFYAIGSFVTLDEALDAGKSTGFEFTVSRGIEVVGYFTIASGWHTV